MSENEKLKTYETMYIIRPNLDEEGVDKSVATIEEFMKNQGCNLEATDKKGRKRLAYEVNKMRDGYYVHTVFTAPASAIVPIKRMMTLSEDVIRSIIVFMPKEAIAAAAQQPPA